MTIIDYLLIAGVVTAGCYTVYRLFLGWLRSPSEEIEVDWGDTVNGAASTKAPVHTGSTTGPSGQPRP